MNLRFKFFMVIILMTLLVCSAFTSRSAYVVNGSASSSGNDCYILTNEVVAVAGSVWYENRITLASDFDMTFQVYLGSNDELGADGIAFVLQPVSNTSLGILGGGMGYMGISPSIIVEYDTWQNDDPYYDHIAIQRNGDVNTISNALAGPVWASAVSDNIEDGLWHSTQITWDAATNTLTVFFDGVLRLTYSENFVSTTFGGDPDVFWGFTGGTGGATNLQQFCITSTTFQEGTPTAVPLSPWAISIAIFLILAATLIRYRKSL